MIRYIWSFCERNTVSIYWFYIWVRVSRKNPSVLFQRRRWCGTDCQHSYHKVVERTYVMESRVSLGNVFRGWDGIVAWIQRTTSYQFFASKLQTHPSLPYLVIIEITPETYFLQHPGQQASSIKGSRETLGFPLAQTVKNLPAMQETHVQSLSWKDPLEKEMATHSSILAWAIPWTEEPGRLQSIGSQRVIHDLERHGKVTNKGASLVPSLYCLQLMTKLPGACRKPTITCSSANFLSIPMDTNCSPRHPVNFSATSSQTIVSPICSKSQPWGREYPSYSFSLLTRPSLTHQIRSDQSLSRVRLFATPWIAARQASLSITNSRSSLRLMSIESVMPSSHLILCCPLLFLPPIPPSISLFQWVNSSHEVAKVLEFQL